MLNADMSIAAVVYSSAMDWQSSPSSTVSRKLFHLVGEAEGGQVIGQTFEVGCEVVVLAGNVKVDAASRLSSHP